MILTEAQRDALSRAAHVLRYYVNDPDSIFRADQIKEDTIVLQAMIDSSGTVEPAGGFDLERARELVWAVSERKIWTLLERTGYGGDIDKRRERQAITEICDKQFPSAINEIERLQLELTQALKDLSSKDEIIEKLKTGFLKSAYERNKVRHGHAWYPDDETYQEYLDGIDADARKNAQESLDDVLRGDVP